MPDGMMPQDPMMGGAPPPQDMGTMTMPPGNEPRGDQELHRANMITVLQMIEKAMPDFITQPKEHKALMTAAKALADVFGQSKAEDITATQKMNMLASLPDSMKQQVQPPGGAIPPGMPQMINPGDTGMPMNQTRMAGA